MEKKNFFESVYENADHDDLSSIPWATLAPNIYLEKHLSKQGPVSGKKALVIGCGLGDDALILEKHGYEVEALDISPSAIALAKKRHPDSRVDFHVGDIYKMPESSVGRYDFVYEGLTIQSLPPADREKLVGIIASLVAKEGELFVYAHSQDDTDSYGGPPWPLYADEFMLFEKEGLEQVYLEKEKESKPVAPYRCCALYRK
ncbi:TPMT family class I SAM-dependent methyltransferase [Sulfurovum sp. XGS-02]|uniref:class I SAM-dependent methyltransferase n=1 Tax=Sulfurovum sp. XGS-02 TaxID=2925411 RepID=UPI00204D25CF|nr:methyltransferase domain-containing protein [Sulfurovum sp. XGS-02]UPT78198.1 TPMT family class I SAM-dependent methyltransferase [Sulfurovum sp. XGS-02]